MKPLLVFSLLVTASTVCKSQPGAWEPTPLTANYINMLYVDPFENVYASSGVDSIFFRSTNAGTTWQTIRSPLLNGVTYACPTMIAVSRSGDIFAANFVYGLFRSSNNGSTWSNSLTPEACASIAIDSSGILFAGLTYTGNGHVSRSTDNGNTWTLIPLPGQPGFATLGYDFNSVGQIFARTIAGVYRSTNGGDSWTRITNGFVRALAMFPSDAMVVCDNLLRSTDRGNTWSQIVPTGLPAQEHLESFATGQQDVLYGQTEGGVYQSTDLGTTWTNLSAGLPPDVFSLAISRNGFVYASTYQGVYRRAMNPTGIDRKNSLLPGSTVLYQNYPNPFNPTTTIELRIASFEFVSLKVFDLLGREVATLVNGQMKPGKYSVRFDADYLPSGVYLYVLRSGSFAGTRKLALMK